MQTRRVFLVLAGSIGSVGVRAATSFSTVQKYDNPEKVIDAVKTRQVPGLVLLRQKGEFPPLAAAHKLAYENLSGLVSGIDLEVNGQSPLIEQAFHVTSYPSVLFCLRGQCEEYKGDGQDHLALSKWCLKSLKSTISNLIKKWGSLEEQQADVASTTTTTTTSAPKKKKNKPTKPKVHELTASTFDQFVEQSIKNKDQPVFVKFYSPHCGWCQRLSPVWEELAQKMNKEAIIARVDATVEHALAGRFQIKGFPTLLLFNKLKKSGEGIGSPKLYQGDRSIEDLTTFLQNSIQKRAKAQRLTSDQEFRESCEGKYKLCFVAFLPPLHDSSQEERKMYVNVINQTLKEVQGVPMGFFWVEAGLQPGIEEQFRLDFGWPAVVSVSLNKQRYAVHQGSYNAKSLSQFIRRLASGNFPVEVLPAEMGKFLSNSPPPQDRDEL